MKRLWLPGALLATIAILAGLAGKASESAWETELADLQYRRYDPYMRLLARRHLPLHHDWTLLKALVRQESHFASDARSGAGAVGLCQIMPATARELGLNEKDLLNPIRNLDAGARYLRWTWNQWHILDDSEPRYNRMRFALASYNAGIGTVQKAWKEAGYTKQWAVIMPYLPEETQAYVTSIMDTWYPLYKTAGLHQQNGFRTYLKARHSKK